MKSLNLIFVVLFFIGNTTAFDQSLKVDSVRVDSIWNSDSTWNENNFVRSRTSRDLLLSFQPLGQGSVACSFSVSLDSGKTFVQNPIFLRVIDTEYGAIGLPNFSKPFETGKRQKYRIRLLLGDTDGVVIKVHCKQYIPSIKGNPDTIQVIGPIDSVCNLTLQVQPSIDSLHPFSKFSKYFWDTAGLYFFYDSTEKPILSWNTKVPDFSKTCGRKNISILFKARDINGLLSNTQLITVRFAHKDAIDDFSTLITGSIENPMASSIDLDSGKTKFAVDAIKMVQA